MIQNFTIRRNSDETLTATIESNIVGDTLVGTTIDWAVYGMTYGTVIGSPVLIFKSTNAGSITIPGSPDMVFYITMDAVDTADLALGNYYHEALIIDEGGFRTPAAFQGVMTITQTEL